VPPTGQSTPAATTKPVAEVTKPAAANDPNGAKQGASRVSNNPTHQAGTAEQPPAAAAPPPTVAQRAWISEWLLRIGIPEAEAKEYAAALILDGIDTAPEVLALSHEDLDFCNKKGHKRLIVSQRHLALDLDQDGTVSAEEYASAGLRPPSGKTGVASSSSALRSFRRAVDTMKMVQKMNCTRGFQPCFLPGVSSAEDGEIERSKMAHISAVDSLVQQEWDEALEEVQEEVQCIQKKTTAQMSCNTAMALHNYRNYRSREPGEGVDEEGFPICQLPTDLGSAAATAKAEEEAAAEASAQAEIAKLEAMAQFEAMLAAEEAEEEEQGEGLEEVVESHTVETSTVLAMARHTAYRQAAKAQGAAMAHGVARSLTLIAKKNLMRESLEKGVKLKEEEDRERRRAEARAKKEAAADEKAKAETKTALDEAAAAAKKKAESGSDSPIPMSSCLKMNPITHFYGDQGPRDALLTVS
jgi:hypothetical protein